MNYIAKPAAMQADKSRTPANVTITGQLPHAAASELEKRLQKMYNIKSEADMDKTEIKKNKEEKRRARVWSALDRFVRPVIRRKYSVDMERVEAAAPYLLIANHAMNLDPFLIGMASPERPLAYVASEHLERLGAITKLLNAAFTLVPRSKASSGFGAVRGILRVLREGKPVVLFAEGDCTWDGVSQPIFPATGKLAKAARAPLVIYRIKGNYLSKPRWADRPRSGRIRGEVAQVISPEELDKMSAEDIDRAINEGIFVNAWEEQKRAPAAYRCKAPAEGLHKALFICPECGRMGGMRSHGDKLCCGFCGAETRMDERGFLHGGKFGAVRDWDCWQRERLGELLGSDERSGPLFEGKGELLEIGGGQKKKVRFGLDPAGAAIVLGDETIPFASVSDIAMVKTDRLLFTANDRYRELRSKRGVLRPYLMAVKLYNEQNGEVRSPRPGKEG